MELQHRRIRLARLSDITAISEMSRDLIEHGLPWTWRPVRVGRAVSDADTNCVVTIAGDRVIAFAIAHFEQHTAHLNLLAVHQECQHRGLGTHLVKWHEAVALTAGIRVFSLEVRAGNEAAIRFYQQLGFRETRVLKRYYSHREDAVRMVHHL